VHHLHQYYDVLVFISTKEVMYLLAVVCLFVMLWRKIINGIGATEAVTVTPRAYYYLTNNF